MKASFGVYCLLRPITISDIGPMTSYLLIAMRPGASITLSQPAVPCPRTQCAFIPLFAITISTYLQHKEKDIQILDTAVRSSFCLGLNCFFIFLPE